MKHVLAFLLSLFAAVGAHAQAIQGNSCPQSPCALSNPTVRGDLVTAIGHGNTPPTSQAGEAWLELYLNNWNGATVGLWYTTAVGGTESISFPSGGVIVGEYPPASFDAVSPLTHSCCSNALITSGSVPVTPLHNGNELLLMWTGYTYGDQLPAPLSAGSGFTLDGQVSGDLALESRSVTADAGGNYSGTFAGKNWPNGAAIASFRFKRYPTLAPRQIKSCVKDGTNYINSCHLDSPVTAGNMIAVPETMGNNVCVTDSQGDSFQKALTSNFYLGPLCYALNVFGGDTTITFPPNTVAEAFVIEYPPSLGLDDANGGSYAFNNPNGDAQGQSSDWGVTAPVLTSQAGDLVIGWEGNGAPVNNLYSPTAGPGATVRGYSYGKFMVADLVTGIPYLYILPVQWNTYGHWVMGAAAFRM